METNKKFKCKDEVILKSKNHEMATWFYAVYSHLSIDGKFQRHIVSNGLGYDSEDYQILPYEGNEHLVGTQDEPDEEVQVKYWEWIMASNICSNDPSTWHLEQCANIKGEDKLETRNKGCYHYFIRFSDFNPNDMEATKAKILCVKGGKVVRYKD